MVGDGQVIRLVLRREIASQIIQGGVFVVYIRIRGSVIRWEPEVWSLRKEADVRLVVVEDGRIAKAKATQLTALDYDLSAT